MKSLQFEIGVWDPVVDSLANENNDQKENLPPDDTVSNTDIKTGLLGPHISHSWI